MINKEKIQNFINVRVLFFFAIFISIIFFDLFTNFHTHILAYENSDLPFSLKWRNSIQAEFMKGNFPLWNTYEYLGVPFINYPQSPLVSPITIILNFFFSIGKSINFEYLISIFISFIGSFFWLRKKHQNLYIVLISCLIISLNGVFTRSISEGKPAFFLTICWFPAILAAIDSFIKEKSFIRVSFISIFLALSYLGGNTELLYYEVFVVFIYYFLEAKEQVFNKYLLTGALFFVCLISFHLLPTIHFIFYESSRNAYFAEISQALSTRLLGLSTFFTHAFWGTIGSKSYSLKSDIILALSNNLYIGLLTSISFISIIVFKKVNSIKWLIVFLCTLFLSFGKRNILGEFVLDNVPLMKFFLHSCYLAYFSVTFLILFLVKNLNEKNWRIEYKKAFRYISIVSVLLLGFFALFYNGETFYLDYGKYFPTDSKSFTINNSIILVNIFTLLILFFLTYFSKKIFLWGSLVLCLFDFSLFTYKSIPITELNKIDNHIGSKEKIDFSYRGTFMGIYTAPLSNVRGYYTSFNNFNQFIYAHLNEKPSEKEQTDIMEYMQKAFIKKDLDGSFKLRKFIEIFNLRYVFVEAGKKIHFIDLTEKKYGVKPTGMFHFYYDWKNYKNKNDIYNEISKEIVDLHRTVFILEEDGKYLDKPHVKKGSKGVVKVISEDSDELFVEVETDGYGILNISRNFTSSWKAYDNLSHSFLKQIETNGVLTGVILPKEGKYSIKLYYDPPNLTVGLFLLYSSLIFWFSYIFYFYRKP